jgi:FPC/CPF motif-containing protein YcgG
MVFSVEGRVYDMGKVGNHPGGPEILRQLKGKLDCTNVFRDIHLNDVNVLRVLDSKCLVGYMKTETSPIPASNLPNIRIFYKPAEPPINDNTINSIMALSKREDRFLDLRRNIELSDVPQWLLEERKSFRNFILSETFGCVAARTAFRRSAFGFSVFKFDDQGSLRMQQDLVETLHAELAWWTHAQSRLWQEKHKFTTFVAVFDVPNGGSWSEDEFEQFLWKLLKDLNEIDKRLEIPWDPHTKSDPADPKFSFSCAGRSFFLVGLHPQSNRSSRRYAKPTIVFNSHAQFEELRRLNLFDPISEATRGRELTLSENKSVSPNLSSFGDKSEALQYSGKINTANWICPVTF